MDFTIDSIWNDRIRLFQRRKGYRFALDAVLLAHFLGTNSAENVLEIGAGNGVIAVLLSYLRKWKTLVAVELQHELAQLCRKNFELNQLSDALVLEIDVRKLQSVLITNSFNLIYSNPPYRKLGAGKLNPDAEKAIARHEVQMQLEDLFRCAVHFLKPNGRLTLILPEFRAADFSNLVTKYGMYWRERQSVHSLPDEPPAFFLATVSISGGPSVEYAPLTIYDSPGIYSPQLEAKLREHYFSD